MKGNTMNPFRIEENRAKYADSKNYAALKSTYNRNYPEIKDANTSKLWNKLNLEFKESEDNNPMARDRIAIVASWLSVNKKKILNIGFGSGNLEEKLLQNDGHDEWHGIDISPVSVKEASKLYNNGKFRTGSVIDLPYNNSYFDSCALLEVLEHIKPSQTFIVLKEVSRVLKKGGILVISVPLNENLEQMASQGTNPNAHIRVYTPELIKAELEIANFKIIKEKKLFAFNSQYFIKSVIVNLLPFLRQPNNIIIYAQKS